MEDAATVWSSNPQCFWCQDPIGSPDQCALNIATGRVVHAGSCELDLMMKQYEWLAAIFRGAAAPQD